MIFLLLSLHHLECKEVGGGFFSWNIFLDQLIYTNWLLHRLIIWLNELLLESNHTLFHIFDILHHAVHYIFHIVCCGFSRYINVVRVTKIKTFFNLLWPIVKNNQWLFPRTVKILDFFGTLVQLCVYVVLVAKMGPNRTVILYQNISCW